MGGLSERDYSKLAPPNSYLHVDQFEGPEHLAAKVPCKPWIMLLVFWRTRTVRCSLIVELKQRWVITSKFSFTIAWNIWLLTTLYIDTAWASALMFTLNDERWSICWRHRRSTTSTMPGDSTSQVIEYYTSGYSKVHADCGYRPYIIGSCWVYQYPYLHCWRNMDTLANILIQYSIWIFSHISIYSFELQIEGTWIL